VSENKMTEALDEIREHWAKAPASNYHHSMSAASVPRLLAAVDAVLEITKPPAESDECPKHPLIRVIRCDEIRNAIARAMTGEVA
jgi:hypothetical protein